MELRPAEIRVLACLLEKQRTTPDGYPLTLNSLRLACNQSTNRDPVVDYDDDVIRDAVHRLERRGLARLASGAGSRAPKFRHLLPDRLPLDDGEQAVLCALMLRGAQTPGELKQRGDRLHAFASLEDVQETLQRLLDRGLAAVQPRRPGQKEQRYMHLLGEEDEPRNDATTPRAKPAAPDGAAPEAGHTEEQPPRYAARAAHAVAASGPIDDPPRADAQEWEELRQRVSRLEHEVSALREALGG